MTLDGGRGASDCPECGAAHPVEALRCARCGFGLNPTHMVGRLVGRYQVEEVSEPRGRLAAIDAETGHWVELRVRPAGLRPRAATSRRPRHPNLVEVLEQGRDRELAFTAVDVRPDEVSLSSQAPLPRSRALATTREVARALASLHASGLTHGALSARDVLLDPTRGSVRVEPPPGGWTEAAPDLIEADVQALGEIATVAAGEVDPELEGWIERLGASAEAAERGLAELLGDAPATRPRPSQRLANRTRRISLPDYAEVEEAHLDPAALERLPLPLAQALIGAWNARPETRRAFVAWEALGRILAAIGVALCRAHDEPPPSALGRPGALDVAGWRAVAREAFARLDRHAPGDALIEAAQRSWGAIGERLAEVAAVQAEASAAGCAPLPEVATQLLIELLDLGTTLPLFAEGRLVAIEQAVWTEAAVTYRPWLLQGLAARQGGSFSGTEGLEPGRLYWQSTRERGFVELDPLAVWHEGRVLFLQRAGARPRYETFDDDLPRALRDRREEVDQLRREAGAPIEDAPDPSGAAVVPDDPHAGRVLGGIYRVVDKIGAGGMGVVYRGWDLRLQRAVALKLLTGVEHLDPKTRERFEAESRVLARLGHPNVVRVYDVGRDGETEFYAMELLPGPTLATWIAEQAPTEEAWERALEAPPDQLRGRARWIRDAARAVHEAHEEGVVHRDLKPGNLMLDPQESVRVLDFGLAHVHGEDRTRTTAQLGTPRYMAPEQIATPRDVDRRADVYALGLSLWALLALQRPFAEVSEEHAVLARVGVGDVPDVRRVNFKVPLDLATIVARATEPNRDDRYPTANALADDLDRWLEGRPVLARPPGRLERLRKYVRREPVNVLVLVVLVLAVFVLAQALANAGSRNDAKAAKQALAYVSAVERKDPDGMVLFAKELEGLEMKPEAFVYYQRAAKAGNVEGMIRLARLAAHGGPRLQDDAVAVRWYRAAQRAGSREAALELEAFLKTRPDLR